MIDVGYVRVMTHDIILVTSLSSCHDITLSLRGISDLDTQIQHYL